MKPSTKKITLQAPLTPQHVRFAEHYILDQDVRASSEYAGIDPIAGAALLNKKSIQAAIQTLSLGRGRRTEIYADEVLRRWWLLATADTRELVQLRHGACRHCYGVDNQYQFTKNELRLAIQQHQQAQVKRQIPQDNWLPFDDLGGEGYDATLQPADDCTECFGIGIPTVWLEDSRNYSAAAALLFDGVKISKDGAIELKMRDRSGAMEKVAQHLGMLVQRQAVVTIDPGQLTDEQLDAVLNQFARLERREAEFTVIEHEDATAEDEHDE